MKLSSVEEACEPGFPSRSSGMAIVASSSATRYQSGFPFLIAPMSLANLIMRAVGCLLIVLRATTAHCRQRAAAARRSSSTNPALVGRASQTNRCAGRLARPLLPTECANAISRTSVGYAVCSDTKSAKLDLKPCTVSYRDPCASARVAEHRATTARRRAAQRQIPLRAASLRELRARGLIKARDARARLSCEPPELATCERLNRPPSIVPVTPRRSAMRRGYRILAPAPRCRATRAIRA